jgi:hypothetical protein
LIKSGLEFIALFLPWTVRIEMIYQHLARHSSAMSVYESLDHCDEVFCSQVFVKPWCSGPGAAGTSTIQTLPIRQITHDTS